MTKNNKIIIAIVVLAVLIILFFAISAMQKGIDAPLAGSENSTTTTTVTNGTTNTNGVNTVNTVNTTNTNTNGRVRAPEDVSIKQGQTGGIEGLSIMFRDVLSDSRCAEDVKCIQAGWIDADVILTSNGKTSEVVLKSNGQVITFAGYKLSILEVAPNKYSDDKITKDSYRIKFHIEPTAAAANI